MAYVDELRALDATDWSRATDCAGWDVRDIAAHVTGAMHEGAKLTVMLRHLRSAKKVAPPLAMVDAINVAQLADRAGVPGPRIADELTRLIPAAARMRRRTPGLVRRQRVPGDDLPAGSTIAYLTDVIYARDIWMHRIDTSRATGRPMASTDGASDVLAQVMRDLGRFWTGPAWSMELTGADPALTGSWLIGAGPAVASVRADAVDYLRLLSGRSAASPTLVTGDPAVHDLATAARVAF